MILRTFQRLSRITTLESEGILRGEWDMVSKSLHPAYRSMVQHMATKNVDTQGSPPIWAWQGEVRLRDAAHLLSPEYELVLGYATIEFDAPTELIVTTGYGAWNDYLAASLDNDSTFTWRPGIDATPGGSQSCLPYLRHKWVRAIRQLPTTGWPELDLNQLA